MAVCEDMDARNACRLRDQRPEASCKIKLSSPSYLAFRASYFAGRSQMYILKCEVR